MKKSIVSVISLTAICLVVSVLLATANAFTAPIIEEAEKKAANEALLVVMPDGEGFEEIDISSYTLPGTVTEVYKEKNGGYVFKMTTSGYSSGLIIMCGVGKDGKITGAVCLASSETLGAEKEYGKLFDGADIEKTDLIDTVSGATKTTSAYKSAIKDALNSFVILNGGDVDIRTEEEILRDNLNIALPSAGGKFEKWFITEELPGIDRVYKAENGEGIVFVSGEDFIGFDKNGNVLFDKDSDIKERIPEYAEKVKNSSVKEIDLSAYSGISDKVIKAYITDSGNFVFDLRAAGYGINGNEEYGISHEYIYIKVSATKDGKIISCVTISQHETEGIGSECENPSYYEKYNGKTEADYDKVDAISGATYTSNGYKNAISKVFETINILKGAEQR